MTIIHNPTEELIRMWIGTDYVLVREQMGREPTEEEIKRLVVASAGGADQDGLRAIISTFEVPAPPPPSQGPQMSRLRVVGRHFANDRGRIDLIGADCYLGLQRYMDGEDLRPIWQELQDYGFNCIRTFGATKYIPEQIGKPPFYPGSGNYTFDRYFPQLSDYTRHAAEYGLHNYFVAGPDAGLWFPMAATPATWFYNVWTTLYDALTALVSVGNELHQHDNFIDVSKLTRPEGIPACAGSEGTNDEWTHGPWWDFDEYHPRRDNRVKSIKDCNVVDHPNYGLGIPINLDELNRFGSNGVDDEEWCALQAGAAMESAGAVVFHSKNGVYAQRFDEQTARHARRFVDATNGHYSQR